MKKHEEFKKLAGPNSEQRSLAIEKNFKIILQLLLP